MYFNQNLLTIKNKIQWKRKKRKLKKKSCLKKC